ncbi:winged helix-turn-helix transcriptional regulator [Halomarina litorea]|uniref:winged helix-turn-helix transcriptional regulator n=1 Tax=Halomarina litorea TaxID=2961595 RepID=UPI0020C2669E|nr:winged helix-turn-helix transcriptional regulator [Halomarina sp. BCD28]
MSDTRERVRAHVREDPGVHFSDLRRALDIAPGQAQYHLRRLVDDGGLVEDALYGQTHYYPPSYDPWERRALALLRRETSADVVACLLDDGPLPPATVAERVGIARSTLSWHVARLTEAGVLVRDESGADLTLRVARPAATARLLRRAEPTLPGRLVDRFTRLVDDLLEE